MELFILLAVIGVLLILTGIIIPIIIRKKRKNKNVSPTNEIATDSSIDEPHVYPVIKKEDHILYDKFIARYDDGSLKFNDINFRKGAVITGNFGISEGFKYDKKGKMEWGYVRVHQGVDRANGGTYTFKDFRRIDDVIQVPFDFNRSSYIDYGNKSYGTLTSLFNDEYGFQLRIAHIDPYKGFVGWSLNRLKLGYSMDQDWVIGSAGTYGASSGEHTHSEIKSIDESSEVMEILLREKFGDKVLIEYTKAQILKEYRKYKHFKDATDSVILKDWQEVRKLKKILFVNKYMVRYVDWGNVIRTRYASNLLFNGM